MIENFKATNSKLEVVPVEKRISSAIVPVEKTGKIEAKSSSLTIVPANNDQNDENWNVRRRRLAKSGHGLYGTDERTAEVLQAICLSVGPNGRPYQTGHFVSQRRPVTDDERLNALNLAHEFVRKRETLSGAKGKDLGRWEVRAMSPSHVYCGFWFVSYFFIFFHFFYVLFGWSVKPKS